MSNTKFPNVKPHIYHDIHELIGAASTCWANIENAGEFKSEKAAEIAERLCRIVDDELSQTMSIIKPGTEAKLDHVLGRVTGVGITEAGALYKFRYWDGAEPKIVWVAASELTFDKSKMTTIGFHTPE